MGFFVFGQVPDALSLLGYLVVCGAAGVYVPSRAPRSLNGQRPAHLSVFFRSGGYALSAAGE